MTDWLLALVPQYGLWLLAATTFCSCLALPFPASILMMTAGGFVAAGFDAELDETRRLRDEGRGVVAAMQADYITQTGVQSLKIKHNNVLGYFIETTTTHAEKMFAPPLSERFIHRQTTANQVRFTTIELNEIETKILNAGKDRKSVV